MTQHTITATNPTFPLRRRSSLAALALSILVIATVGIIVLQFTWSDSSTQSRPATGPAAVPQAMPMWPADVPFVNPYAAGDFNPTAPAVPQAVPTWPANVPFVNPYARGDFNPTAPAVAQTNPYALPADVPFVNPYARGDFSPTA